MSIRWRELNPSAPQWGLASASDMPATTRGEGVGAVVQFASQNVANQAINIAIQRILTQESTAADHLLPRGRLEGVLAVIRIEVNRHDQQLQYSNPFLYHPLMLADSPAAAVQRWQNEPRMEAPPHGPTGQYQRRYFWASRF